MNLAPCPICGRTPRLHELKTGFVISCVGDRHTVAMTDDGIHQATLYRGKSVEEVSAFWNKTFAKDTA